MPPRKHYKDNLVYTVTTLCMQLTFNHEKETEREEGTYGTGRETIPLKTLALIRAAFVGD